MYLLKILLYQSASKFRSGINIYVSLVFREIRPHISMSNIFYHSISYRKYYLVMESIIPISYHNLWMVLWGYFHSYWIYITRSSYYIFGYLHDFLPISTLILPNHPPWVSTPPQLWWFLLPLSLSTWMKNYSDLWRKYN